MDIGFAIGSIVRLQVPRVRMANGWALGKFAGEFAQGTQTYVGQLQSGLFLRAYFCVHNFTCPFVALNGHWNPDSSGPLVSKKPT